MYSLLNKAVLVTTVSLLVTFVTFSPMQCIEYSVLSYFRLPYLSEIIAVNFGSTHYIQSEEIIFIYGWYYYDEWFI